MQISDRDSAQHRTDDTQKPLIRPADKEILKRLEEEGKKKGVPARFLEFYQRLFRLQSRTERRIGKAKPSLKRDIINERLQRGQPLIGFNELNIDWSLLKEIFTEVRTTFSDYPDLFGELPKLQPTPPPLDTINGYLVSFSYFDVISYLARYSA